MYYICYDLYRCFKKTDIIDIIDFSIENGYIDCAYIAYKDKTLYSLLYKKGKKVNFKKVFELYQAHRQVNYL